MTSPTRKNNPGSLYGSFCEGYGHFWLLLGKISKELSSETVEKVTKSRSSKTNLACHELIMRFIVKYIYIYIYMNIFRPTDPLFLWLLLVNQKIKLAWRKEHSDIASYVMAVIKELRWLPAAGECGRAATRYRLATSDESVRLTVYETILDVYLAVYYANVV